MRQVSTTDIDVYLIPGIPFPLERTSWDGDEYWAGLVGAFEAWGWRGKLLRVGLAAADTNIEVCLGEDGAAAGKDVPIKELGRRLAWRISANQSPWGRYVSVVGHSMGGLVVRAALTGVQITEPGFPPSLDIDAVVIMLAHPHGGRVSLATLSLHNVISVSIVVAIVVCVSSYVGVEDAVNYGEEARRGSIGRAMVSCVVVAAIVYALSAWAISVAAGSAEVVAAARTGAPANASTTQSVLAMAVIAAAAIWRWDPLITMFFWMGTLAGLGVVALMTLASAAVVGFFWRDHRGERLAYRVALPVLSVGGLGAVFVLTLTQYATLLGVPPGSPLTWQLPSLIAVVFALGVLRAAYLRTFRASAGLIAEGIPLP